MSLAFLRSVHRELGSDFMGVADDQPKRLKAWRLVSERFGFAHPPGPVAVRKGETEVLLPGCANPADQLKRFVCHQGHSCNFIRAAGGVLPDLDSTEATGDGDATTVKSSLFLSAGLGCAKAVMSGSCDRRLKNSGELEHHIEHEGSGSRGHPADGHRASHEAARGCRAAGFDPAACRLHTSSLRAQLLIQLAVFVQPAGPFDHLPDRGQPRVALPHNLVPRHGVPLALVIRLPAQHRQR